MFFAEQRAVALATTVIPTARPHVVPVSPVLDLDRIVFATEGDTREGAQPRAATRAWRSSRRRVRRGLVDSCGQVIVFGEAQLIEQRLRVGARPHPALREVPAVPERGADRGGVDGDRRRRARPGRDLGLLAPLSVPREEVQHQLHVRDLLIHRVRVVAGAVGVDARPPCRSRGRRRPTGDAFDRAPGVVLAGDHDRGCAHGGRRRSSGRCARTRRARRRACRRTRRRPTPGARARTPSGRRRSPRPGSPRRSPATGRGARRRGSTRGTRPRTSRSSRHGRRRRRPSAIRASSTAMMSSLSVQHTLPISASRMRARRTRSTPGSSADATAYPASRKASSSGSHAGRSCHSGPPWTFTTSGNGPVAVRAS